MMVMMITMTMHPTGIPSCPNIPALQYSHGDDEDDDDGYHDGGNDKDVDDNNDNDDDDENELGSP